MANITWNNLELVRTDDIFNFLSSPELPLRFSSNNNDQSALIETVNNKIQISKDYIFFELRNHLRKIVPDEVQKWFATKRDQLNMLVQTMGRDLELLSRSMTVPFAGLVQTGTVLTMDWWMMIQNGINPMTFTTYGTPVSGLGGDGNNQALIGAILVDVLNFIVYVNTSKDITQPNWVRLFAYTLMDQLLFCGYDINNNKGSMYFPALYLTIHYMLRDGTLSNRSGYDGDTGKFFINQSKYYMDEFTREFDKNKKNVIIDVDNDGSVSNFENSLNNPRTWMFKNFDKLDLI